MLQTMADEHLNEHPEDLLDLAAAGQLESAAWKDLQRHISACAPCAEQLSLGLGAVGSRKAGDFDGRLDRASIHRVLGRLNAPHRPARARFPRRRMSLVFGTLLLSGSATAAATWWSLRPAARPAVETLMGPPAVVGSLARKGVHVARPSAAAPVEAAPAPAAAADMADLPSDRPRAERSDREDRVSANVLFRRARAQRVDGDADGAIATYRRLQGIHPRSSEARLSYLIVGRMYLETGRPALAGGQFGSYLAAGGGAWQEALVGRASAFQRLGRSQEERADWRALLARDPQSLYAARARARLDELGRSPEAARSGATGH
ncbi:MAG: tetratricopeptide repeat protein [Pseudomonadota bacterium]